MDIYLLARVSSHRQEKEETVETQLEYLRGWASLNKHRIVGTYVDEAVSGTVPLGDRPEGSRLLTDLAASTDRDRAVVVYRLDRLGRSALVIHEAAAIFEKAKVGLVSAKEGFDSTNQMGRMMLGLIALFAEFERDAIRQRCMDGRLRVARLGKWTGGRSKFGFTLDDEGKFTPTPDAITVQEIFAEFESGKGLRRLGRWLNDRGIPSPSGGTRWHHATLCNILTDPAYHGRAVWAGIEFDCPALVTELQWQRVQRRLKDPERRPIGSGRRPGTERAYVLSGLIHCGLCGKAFSGQKWKNGRKLPEGHHGYICNGKDSRHGGPRCAAPWFDGDLEEEILAECQRWLDNPHRLRELLASQRETSHDAVEGLRREKHRLQQQRADLREERATLVTQLGKKRITDADFDRRNAEIAAGEEALENHISTLELRLSGLRHADDDLAEREELLEGMRGQNWSPEDKIRLLVRDVRVFPGENGGARVKVTYWPSKQGEVDSSASRCRHLVLLAPVLTYQVAA